MNTFPPLRFRVKSSKTRNSDNAEKAFDGPVQSRYACWCIVETIWPADLKKQQQQKSKKKKKKKRSKNTPDAFLTDGVTMKRSRKQIAENPIIRSFLSTDSAFGLCTQLHSRWPSKIVGQQRGDKASNRASHERKHEPWLWWRANHFQAKRIQTNTNWRGEKPACFFKKEALLGGYNSKRDKYTPGIQTLWVVCPFSAPLPPPT